MGGNEARASACALLGESHGGRELLGESHDGRELLGESHDWCEMLGESRGGLRLPEYCRALLAGFHGALEASP